MVILVFQSEKKFEISFIPARITSNQNGGTFSMLTNNSTYFLCSKHYFSLPGHMYGSDQMVYA